MRARRSPHQYATRTACYRHDGHAALGHTAQRSVIGRAAPDVHGAAVCNGVRRHRRMDAPSGRGRGRYHCGTRGARGLGAERSHTERPRMVQQRGCRAHDAGVPLLVSRMVRRAKVCAWQARRPRRCARRGAQLPARAVCGAEQRRGGARAQPHGRDVRTRAARAAGGDAGAAAAALAAERAASVARHGQHGAGRAGLVVPAVLEDAKPRPWQRAGARTDTPLEETTVVTNTLSLQMNELLLSNSRPTGFSMHCYQYVHDVE